MHAGAGEVHPETLLPAAGRTDADEWGQTHSRLVQERCSTQTFVPRETVAEASAEESESQ